MCWEGSHTLISFQPSQQAGGRRTLPPMDHCTFTPRSLIKGGRGGAPRLAKAPPALLAVSGSPKGNVILAFPAGRFLLPRPPSCLRHRCIIVFLPAPCKRGCLTLRLCSGISCTVLYMLSVYNQDVMAAVPTRVYQRGASR